MQVFLVTRGSYSDYEIIAVYLGEAAADTRAAEETAKAPEFRPAYVETWTTED
jgi:hypothetical protein